MNGQRIFADNAARYAEHGLVTFPVGGPDGKKPIVGNWNKFRVNTYENFLDKHANANLAFRNDDKIVVVDVDDDKHTHYAIGRFGDTPVKVKTSPNRMHLYYRSSGEKRIIGLDGLKIDVLGVGGYTLAPPSIKATGERYSYIDGSEYDLDNLPPLKAGSLPVTGNKKSSPNKNTGFRNDELYKACLRFAKKVNNEEELLHLAFQENAKFEEPLEAAEVQRIANSAWKKQISGDNWVGESTIGTRREWLEILKYDKDAFYLMVFLKAQHEGIRETFFIDQEKVAPLIGVGCRKVMRRAIETLIRVKLIKRIGKVKRAYLYGFV